VIESDVGGVEEVMFKVLEFVALREMGMVRVDWSKMYELPFTTTGPEVCK
jgi:hypothetical protein